MIQLHQLLKATEGQLCGPAHSTAFESFCFDSRLAQPGQLFLAVKTERADGHDYILNALERGAAGVVCQRPVDVGAHDATCVLVADTRLAIQEWAHYVLAEQAVRVVGVTGSVGKTTTKEAIAAVLGARFNVFRNQANYNGLYGLPIALGALRPEHELAVLELAADHFGEIKRLCEIAPPLLGVVTTVEPAHFETFGSLEAIAREKAELVAALPANGYAVLNADDERVLSMAAGTAARVITYGTRTPGAGTARPDVWAGEIISTRDGIHFVADTPAGRRKVALALLGRHQVYAALAALAAGLALGLSLDSCVERLAALPHLPGRLNPLPGQRGTLLLDDTYSASPAAVQAALETLSALDGRRKIAVLGDMLELGSYEEPGHAEVGRQAARLADALVTKGNRARRIAEAARAAGMPADQITVTYTAEDAARAVLDRLSPGDVVLIKGSLATRMEQVTRALLADPGQAAEVLVRQDAAWQQTVTVIPDRPTWLEVDLGAIAQNVRQLKALAGPAQVMVSLKADAYGHGAVQVAQTALLNGASWLGVACYGEGLALRQAGIDAPILILGYTPAWQARDVVRNNITATVFDLDVAGALSRAARALDRVARVHVKVDTGMGRLGVFPGEAVAFVQALAALPDLVIEGIFTHLSVADDPEGWGAEYTAGQLAEFAAVLEALPAAGIQIPLIHALNSAGLLRTAQPDGSVRSAHADDSLRAWSAQHTLVRPGIAVYGLDPSPEVRCPAGFRPALAWKTQVAQVKQMPPGSYVGYGATYQTTGHERIAVIPVGYADGFRRAPRHWGEVLVRGERAPIVGRVCMDQAMIDVTHIPGVRQGDEVVLIGSQGPARISAEEVAARLGTINYEVVSAILARVPRENYG